MTVMLRHLKDYLPFKKVIFKEIFDKIIIKFYKADFNKRKSI